MINYTHPRRTSTPITPVSLRKPVSLVKRAR